MTLYLKYRPQTIAELDLVSVREALAKIMQSGKVPHAWLMSGPRGTGKTSSARIVAKVVCCEKGGSEPCNECSTCLAITAGTAPDVIEIDAASNRGIDEMRDLREKVRLAPMQAKYKVYIIDEVHMLTVEAANALLKTLEEPPERTIFMLCTTDPERLPETVISRCTRVMFKKPTQSESVASLQRVVRGEGLKVGKGTLEILAKESRGSFRDATKVLEQILMIKNELNEEGVREVLELQKENDPEEFLRMWETGDVERGLKFLSRMVDSGANLRAWVERVVEELRERLLVAVETRQSVGIRQSLVDKIRKLEKAYGEIKTASVPQLPLEIMLVEDQGPPSHKATEGQGHPSGNRENQIKKEGVKEETRVTGTGKYNLDDLNNKWGDVLRLVKPKNHSVEGLLRSTRISGFDGEKVTLEVFYKFHKDKLETEKCRTIVEEAVGEAFGVDGVKLFLQLGEKSRRKENLSGQVGEDILKAAEDIFKAEVV